MITTLSLIYSLMAVRIAPTVGMIERLSPRAAGDLILKGQEHRPIVGIETPPNIGPGPIGIVERDLVERPMVRSGGCLRTRWKVKFEHEGGTSAKSAKLSATYARTEVGLPLTSGCDNASFVSISPEISPEEALAALRYLNDIRSGKAAIQFFCFDEVSSGLCNGDDATRGGLASVAPWQVLRRDGSTLIWLGEPGQIATEVRYPVASPGHIMVNRRIPPPF